MVNLVGRMSPGERLYTDLGEPDTDKRNPNGITRRQSIMGNAMKISIVKIGPRSERHLVPW